MNDRRLLSATGVRGYRPKRSGILACVEKVYIKDYETVEELNNVLRSYFEFYNTERLHASLGGRTSVEVYNEISTLRKTA